MKFLGQLIIKMGKRPFKGLSIEIFPKSNIHHGRDLFLPRFHPKNTNFSSKSDITKRPYEKKRKEKKKPYLGPNKP